MNKSFEQVGHEEVMDFSPECQDESKAATLVDLLALAETFSADDPVRLYLTEIAKVPPLADGEEDELLRAVADGMQSAEVLQLDNGMDLSEDVAQLNERVEKGNRAKQRLAEANLHLVVSIAMEYLDRGMFLLDLLQEGNLGLINAFDTFDYAKDTSFVPHATRSIRRAISYYITPRAPRIPVHMIEAINKVLHTEHQLMQELGYPPSAEEIAAVLDVPADQIHNFLHIVREPVGPEPPMETDPSCCSVPPHEETIAQLKEHLSDVLPLLTPREQKILELRFGLDNGRSCTPKEVAKELGGNV